MSDKINSVELETRIFNIGDLRFTPGGDAVCNARTNVAGKVDDKWEAEWIEVTAWGDAAEKLAHCKHGDDVILRKARLGGKAYRKKDGTLVTEVQINCNDLERVGSLDAGSPAPSRSTVPDDQDVPF